MEFYYQGIEAGDPNGAGGDARVDGTIEADDERAARLLLEARRIEVTHIEEAEPDGMHGPSTSAAATSRPRRAAVSIVISDVEWPFFSMLVFQLKWAAASAMTLVLLLPIIWLFLSVLRSMVAAE